ncbi:hypothetical protein HAX54_023387 [Datura stramonium]|uniref:Uncharacterized protein n=1 Tax=Datura stramonium TaxID=4076 RepID=A0ABS8UYP6_DATST|nr:hypothetical protein [Datura stramonium]
MVCRLSRTLPSKARRHRACLLDQALGRASAWLDIEGISQVSKHCMVASYASADVAHFFMKECWSISTLSRYWYYMEYEYAAVETATYDEKVDAWENARPWMAGLFSRAPPVMAMS